MKEIAALVLREEDKSQQHQEGDNGIKFAESSVPTESPFKQGETVFYKGGELATILKVHRDDDMEPYYTIKVKNGSGEKQTTRAHLQRSRVQTTIDRDTGFPQGALVTLKATTCPGSNNRRGRVVDFDSEADEYGVELFDYGNAETRGMIANLKAKSLFPHQKVHLCRMESQPHLNGHQGVLIDWEATEEKYVVYMLSLYDTVLRLKPSNVVLSNRSMIQVTGLVENPSFNGKQGTIQRMDYQTDRYVVKLSNEIEIRLKLENVIVIGCQTMMMQSEETENFATEAIPRDDEDLVFIDAPFVNEESDPLAPSSSPEAVPSNLHQSPSPAVNAAGAMAQGTSLPHSVTVPTDGPNPMLAESIQNTLGLGRHDNSARPTNVATAPYEEDDESTITSSTTAGCHSQGQRKAKKKKDKNPGLWKLAGRSIKKNIPGGKAVLNGFRDVGEAARKVLSIGMGEIHLSAPTTTVFRMGSTVEGTVRLELTEVIPGSRLVVHFWASQKSYAMDTHSAGKRDGSEIAAPEEPFLLELPNTIYKEKYLVAGERLYEDGDTFSFRVLIPPQVRYVVSEEITRNSFSDSLESSTQTTSISSRVSSPIEWHLMAYLTIPGRLSMDSKVVKIHVEPPPC